MSESPFYRVLRSKLDASSRSPGYSGFPTFCLTPTFVTFPTTACHWSIYSTVTVNSRPNHQLPWTAYFWYSRRFRWETCHFAKSSNHLDRPSQDSSVRIGTSLQAVRFGIRIPARSRDFFFPLENIHTSGSHPALPATSTGVCFSDGQSGRGFRLITSFHLNQTSLFISFSLLSRHCTMFVVEVTASNNPW